MKELENLLKLNLKNYGQDFEVELSKGFLLVKNLVPVNTAGCYVLVEDMLILRQQ